MSRDSWKIICNPWRMERIYRGDRSVWLVTIERIPDVLGNNPIRFCRMWIYRNRFSPPRPNFVFFKRIETPSYGMQVCPLPDRSVGEVIVLLNIRVVSRLTNALFRRPLVMQPATNQMSVPGREFLRGLSRQTFMHTGHLAKYHSLSVVLRGQGGCLILASVFAVPVLDGIACLSPRLYGMRRW